MFSISMTQKGHFEGHFKTSISIPAKPKPKIVKCFRGAKTCYRGYFITNPQIFLVNAIYGQIFSK